MSGDANGRCTKPSTQMHGGGYLEVCFMCDEHADSSPREWKWQKVGPQHEGMLDTYIGKQKDRRRCQYVNHVESTHD